MDTYVYKFGNSIYINLTNKCTNACTFCLRNVNNGVGGYDLRIEREPQAHDVIRELEKEQSIPKAVFCGFGEPTMRLPVLLEIAEYLKKRGAHVRLDTNGQGSAYAGHDITPELKDAIDAVSISLNAPDAAGYQKLCVSIYKEKAFGYVVDFAKGCIKQGIETTLSVVDIISFEQIEKSRELAESIGAEFRIRQLIE